MNAPESATLETPTPTAELTLRFQGQAREYFRIWIVNLFLTLATLGIFSAWAKVRKKRYFYSHTLLDGTPFQYLGQPIPILKGRILAALLFVLYYLSDNIFTELLPYVLVGGALLAPWVVAGSAAFNARYSAFRNMRFSFDGGYRQAFGPITFNGLLVLAAIGIGFATPEDDFKITAALVVILSLVFPWWQRRAKAFIVNHMGFGHQRGDFSATTGQFFKVYLAATLFLVAIVTVVAVLAFMVPSISGSKEPMLMTVVVVGPIYLAYILAYAYTQAKIGNLSWNNTRLGPLRFKSSLTGRGLARLYLTNGLAILASAGLLIPWAVMRTLAYRVDCLRVLPEGDLNQFDGSQGAEVRAAGAEVGEFFDLDLSL